VRIAAIRLDGNTIPQGALTDRDGHYLLQNVPEGEYYLTVLEGNRKTFFPGVADQTAATAVRVKSLSEPGHFDFSIPTR
jgi:hypothetical protein